MQMRLLKLKRMQNFANISHSVISITPNKKMHGDKENASDSQNS